jgi:translocation and assembly module TamB
MLMLTGAPEVAAPALPPRRRSRWIAAAAKIALSLVIAAMLALGALGLLLDTDLGHRLILDRIADLRPQSGLRIRIGRIEGSIWGRSELRDLRLYDPEGLFAEAPEVEVEWRPLSWLWNRLVIHRAASDLVIVHRLPALIESAEPTLPSADVHVGRIEIAQLRFEEGVAGARRSARVEGEIEYRSGRFLLDLDARMRDGGDRLDLLVDAAPDRDEFDLDLSFDAPADGVLARMLGTERAVRIEAKGDGDWRRWAGNATFGIDGRPGGELRLAAASGLYRAEGWLAAAPLLSGTLAALAGTRTAVSARGRFDEGVLDGRIAARSAAMRLAAAGRVDLRRDRYSDVRATIEMLAATPLIGELGAPGARVTAVLDGPFADASIAYRAAAPRLLLGTTRFEAVQASGSGRWTRDALTLPVTAGVGRVGGAGEAVADLLAGLRIDGTMRAAGGRLRSDGLSLASGRMRGRLAFQADPRTGRYAVAGTAAADGVPLPGIGRADLQANLRATSAAPLAGTLSGVVRRVDNAALAWAAGGPLRLQSGIAGSGGAIHFPDLRLSAPALQLSGAGSTGPGDAVRFQGSGRHASLGPLALRVEGSAARPLLALRLARPAASLGLSNVNVVLEPAGANFAYRAGGGSLLGPFSARGTIAPRRGRAAAITVSALSVSGTSGSGALQAGPEGVAGRLDFAGALAGPLLLASTEGGVQSVETHLIATDARLGRVPIGSGRVDATVRIGARGETLQGRVRFAGTADRLWSLAGMDAVRLSGPLAVEAELGGSVAAPVLRGTATLRRGRIVAGGTTVENVDANGSFDRSRLAVERASGQMSGGGRIEAAGTVAFDGALALRLNGERIAFVRRGLDSRWNAALRVGGSVAAPALFGEATLVSGTYLVLGRPVPLSRGTLRFDGSADPLLDLVARPGFGPSVLITGRASRPQVGFGSPF